MTCLLASALFLKEEDETHAGHTKNATYLGMAEPMCVHLYISTFYIVLCACLDVYRGYLDHQPNIICYTYVSFNLRPPRHEIPTRVLMSKYYSIQRSHIGVIRPCECVHVRACM